MFRFTLLKSLNEFAGQKNLQLVGVSCFITRELCTRENFKLLRVLIVDVLLVSAGNCSLIPFCGMLR